MSHCVRRVLISSPITLTADGSECVGGLNSAHAAPAPA